MLGGNGPDESDRSGSIRSEKADLAPAPWWTTFTQSPLELTAEEVAAADLLAGRTPPAPDPEPAALPAPVSARGRLRARLAASLSTPVPLAGQARDAAGIAGAGARVVAGAAAVVAAPGAPLAAAAIPAPEAAFTAPDARAGTRLAETAAQASAAARSAPTAAPTPPSLAATPAHLSTTSASAAPASAVTASPEPAPAGAGAGIHAGASAAAATTPRPASGTTNMFGAASPRPASGTNSSSGVATPVAANGRRSAVDAAPSGAVADAARLASAGRPPGGGRPGRPRLLIWSVGGLVVVLALAALFFLGQSLVGGDAAPVAVATSSATPAPSATPSGAPSAPPEATGPQPVGVHQWDTLFGGECLQPYVTPWEEEFTVADCATPHAAQLVYRGVFVGDAATAFPGEAELAGQINLLCSATGVIDLAAASAYGDVQVQGSYPITEEQWSDGGRSYYCFVSRASGEPMNASIAGPGPVPAA